MKKCPYCAEEIQDEAIKCRFCGEMLQQKAPEKWYFRASLLVTAFLCLGPLALPLLWFNPRIGPKAKLIISIIVIIVTYILGILFVNSLKSLNQYYQQLNQPMF